MRKLITLAAIAAILTLTVPTAASASGIYVSGACVISKDGQVVLKGKVEAYYVDATWVYRGRPVGSKVWTTLSQYRVTEYFDDGWLTSRFRSNPRLSDGMVYRLDLYLDSGDSWRPLAHYNDRTTAPEDCRHVA